MTDQHKDYIRRLLAKIRKQAKGRALARVLGFDFSPQEHSTEIEDAVQDLVNLLLHDEYQKWVKHYEQLNREGKL